MLTFSKNRDIVNTEEYENNLRCNGYIMCCSDEMELQHLYDAALRDSMYVYAVDIMKRLSGYSYNGISRNTLYNYLTKVEGCPDRYFYKKGVKGTSLDMKKVLQPLYDNGYAKEFLEAYMEYTSCSSKCSAIASIIRGIQDSGLSNRNGSRLGKLAYTVNQQTNLRYNYRNYDIISQIPKDYAKFISVEEGYFLAWGDFAQADLRIAYNLLLRNEENYGLMASVTDKYEGIARLVADANNEPFDYEKFKAERNLYKVYVLETLYGTRVAATKEESNFVKKLHRYLGTCRKYNDYLQRIADRQMLNLPIVTKGFFGYEQAVPSYKTSAEDIKNFSLNSPIQTGTSEVMILTVNKIIKMLRTLGYGEEDASVYMARHDEVVFKCKNTVLKDAWVFKEASIVQVDDWIPMQLDFSFGYNYCVPDSELEKIVHMNYKENDYRITYSEPQNVGVSEKYFPIAEVIRLTYHLSAVGANTILTIVNLPLKAYSVYVIHGTAEEVIKKSVVGRINEIVQSFPEDDYQGTLVEGNVINGGLYENGKLIKFLKVSNASLYSAQCISEFYANNYAKGHSMDAPYSDRSSEMHQFKEYRQLSALFSS